MATKVEREHAKAEAIRKERVRRTLADLSYCPHPRDMRSIDLPTGRPWCEDCTEYLD